MRNKDKLVNHASDKQHEEQLQMDAQSLTQLMPNETTMSMSENFVAVETTNVGRQLKSDDMQDQTENSSMPANELNNSVNRFSFIGFTKGQNASSSSTEPKNEQIFEMITEWLNNNPAGVEIASSENRQVAASNRDASITTETLDTDTLKEQASLQQDSFHGDGDEWQERFDDSSKQKFDELIRSLNVIKHGQQENTGWQVYNCAHRFGRKCPYRARSIKLGHQYIVEEKEFHCHGSLLKIDSRKNLQNPKSSTTSFLSCRMASHHNQYVQETVPTLGNNKVSMTETNSQLPSV